MLVGTANQRWNQIKCAICVESSLYAPSEWHFLTLRKAVTTLWRWLSSDGIFVLSEECLKAQANGRKTHENVILKEVRFR